MDFMSAMLAAMPVEMVPDFLETAILMYKKTGDIDSLKSGVMMAARVLFKDEISTMKDTPDITKAIEDAGLKVEE